MKNGPERRARTPVVYCLLDLSMRLVARLVPAAHRDRWRAEWEGELWYGVAAKAGTARLQTVFVVVAGMLSDAFEVRRLSLSRRRHTFGRGSGLMNSRFHNRGLGTRAQQTLRRLLTEWRYSAAVVLILGIGIGPAAVGLTMVSEVLLQPLAFQEPDRIGAMRVDVGDLVNHPGLDANEIFDLRETEGLFKAVEWLFCSPVWMEIGEEAVPVPGAARVSPGLFEMLGVHPIMGRSFRPGENDANVVILGHDIWRTSFAEDSDIVGRSVSVQGTPHEVVGVLPPDFKLRFDSGSDVPSSIDLWRISRARRDSRTSFFWFNSTLVRLEDGVSFEHANANLETFARRELETYPSAYGDSQLRFSVSPLLADLVRETKPALIATLAGVLLLLVTATVNASALVVVGQRKRSRELAVRAAVGASRRILLTDVFIETVLLSMAGCVVGSGLAAWGIVGLREVVPREVPRWENIVFGWEAVVLPACLAALVLLLVAVVSASSLTNNTPWKALGTGSDRTKTPRAAGQSILVGFQVVMAVVLLFGAVQLFRSVRELAKTDLGFDARKTIAFEVPLYSAGLSREEENARYMQIRDRLEQLPGVVSVGAISNPPLHGRGTINTFTLEGTQAGVAGGEQLANFYAVIPGYFESINNPIIRGRDLTDVENSEGIPVAVIDETLARMAFPGQNPIGKTINVAVLSGASPGRGQTDPRIVGVVAHSRVIDPTRNVRPQVYLPFGLWYNIPLYVTVRTLGDPRSVMPAAREVVRELGTGEPILQVDFLADNLSSATSVLRAVASIVVVLALSAAFLSALGLYAVVSYIVIQQRRATAIRSVLGASPGSLLRMQLIRVGVILFVAAPVGLTLSIGGARLLESLVYGVAVRDVGSLAAATALGVLVGLLAAYVPARRAAKADLRVALEAE